MKFFCAAFAIMGCRKKVSTKGGFCCDEHRIMSGKRVADALRPQWPGAERPNASLYRSTRWTELSKRIRKEHGECVLCGATDTLSVHHVIQPKGNAELFYDESNVVVLCKECHDRLTSVENRTGRR